GAPAGPSALGALVPSRGGVRPAGAAPRRGLLWIAAGTVVGALAVAAGLVAVGRVTAPSPSAPAASTPTYRRLTFYRGSVWGARFGPDGQTVSWGGGRHAAAAGLRRY